MKCARAWMNVGLTLNNGETILINGNACTNTSCFVEVLQIEPWDVNAWYSLACSLENEPAPLVADAAMQEEVEKAQHTGDEEEATSHLINVNGTFVSSRDCILEALRLNPTFYSAWARLAASMAAGEVLDVNGTACSKLACCVEALLVNSQYIPAWYTLGASMHAGDVVGINGTYFTQRECFVQVLRLAPTHHLAWHHLGFVLGPHDVVVLHDGQSHGKIECYVRAIELNAAYYQKWFHLALALQPCTITAATVAPLAQSTPSHASTDVSRAPPTATTTVAVLGTERTQKACFLETCRLQPNHAEAWMALAQLLLPQDATTVTTPNGTLLTITQQQCHVQVLRMRPCHGLVWCHLGQSFPTSAKSNEGGVALNDFVRVNKADYSQKDCFIEAVRYTPSLDHAWFGLASLMTPEESIFVERGDNVREAPSMTAKDCYNMALQLNPENAQAWYNIAALMAKSEAVYINGKRYIQKACYKEACRLQ